MASELAASFLPSLIGQTAVCLNSLNPREYAEQRATARDQFLALRRGHEALRAAIGLIHAALGKLEAAGAEAQPPTNGLAHALEMFRAKRAGNVSWLDLYCTTMEAIESINFRSTKSLSRLNDDQLGVVLKFAREACAFLEIDYNRDFEAAGMAVTCDRLVEQGITSDADVFRVATLRRRFEEAERGLAENGARWSATFEAMASQLEEGFASRLLARSKGARHDGPELDSRARPRSAVGAR